MTKLRVNLVFFAAMLCSMSGHSQQDSLFTVKDLLDRGYLIGGASTAGFSLWYDPPGNGPNVRAWLVETRPRIAVMVTRSQALGITATIGVSGGNAFQTGHYYGVGGFWRGYLFMKGRQSLLAPAENREVSLFPFESTMNPRARAYVGMNVFPFVEAGLSFANYQIDTFGYRTFSTLNQPQIEAGIGLNLRIIRRLSLEWTLMARYLPGNPVGSEWRTPNARIGLDYFIPTRKTTPFPKKVLSQFDNPRENHKEVKSWVDTNQYVPRLQGGLSFTYIWDSPPSLFKEYTWSFNLAFSPIRRLYFGVNSLWLHTRSATSPRQKARLNGVFTSYYVGHDTRLAFMPQVGFYLGNYCTCGDSTDPYVLPRLSYLEVGAGFEYGISRSLKFEFSFLVYNILQDVPEKYSYTQYILGLNYNLRLKRSR